MAYELRAVIAESELLEATQEVAEARFFPLHGSLSLLPITHAYFDAVSEGPDDRALGFWGMPGGFASRISHWSATGPVAYVEAEYFGGVGEQHAAVWEGGARTLGPLHLPEGEPLPADGGPISQALRYLGVSAGHAHDEFEAAGLHRHRHTEDWAPPPPA